MILVGATCVGIGSAVYHHSYGVFQDVCAGIEAYMQQHGYHSLEEFRGKAL
jgi:dihydroorotate dehydrogenase